MRICWLSAVGLVFLGLHAYGETKSSSGAVATFPDHSSWHFEFSNDVFFLSDNNISNGMSFQYNSAAAQDWSTMKGVPGFLRRLGRLVPASSAKHIAHRFSLAVTQTLQTPDDLNRVDLIPEDVPYAGILTLQACWYAYDDTRFNALEATVGVVGSLSLAGQAQEAAHKLLKCTVPQGWDNQLPNEPLLNISYLHKGKIWDTSVTDAAIAWNVTLGNYFTQASADIELRLGTNLPGGFLYVPDPICYNMHYQATLKPPRPDRCSLFGSLVFRGTALAHNIFLDGNLLRKSHSVDRKAMSGQIVAGLHLTYRSWGIHLYASFSTPLDYRDGDREDKKDRIGGFILEWRF